MSDGPTATSSARGRLPEPVPARTTREDHRTEHIPFRALDGRVEDAEYWKGCAPAVIRRAAEVRGDRQFQRLPG